MTTYVSPPSPFLQHTQFWPLRESDGPGLQPYIAAGRGSCCGHLTHIPELPVPGVQEFLPSSRSDLEVSDWLEETRGNSQLCRLWQHSQVRWKWFLQNICECLKLSPAVLHVVNIIIQCRNASCCWCCWCLRDWEREWIQSCFGQMTAHLNNNAFLIWPTLPPCGVAGLGIFFNKIFSQRRVTKHYWACFIYSRQHMSHYLAQRVIA